MNKNYDCAEIIEDSDEENVVVEIKKKTKTRTPPEILKKWYNEENDFEIGVDEAGRGPLFGRVYAAAVVLPKDESLFDFSKMKDSKKFTSKKKINDVAEYIKTHAVAWSVKYADENLIDNINILQATMATMRSAIQDVREQLGNIKDKKEFLLIDGNYFTPITYLNESRNQIMQTIPYVTVEGGDNKYASIAAASILAKVERDNYIEELCKENPELCEKYSIDKNKGYGSKQHLDGIRNHGITEWHRKTFGICKKFVEKKYD